jgi:hypothetical protein
MPSTAAQSFLVNIIVRGDAICAEGGEYLSTDSHFPSTIPPRKQQAPDAEAIRLCSARRLRDAHNFKSPAKPRDRDDWWSRSGNAAGRERQIDR